MNKTWKNYNLLDDFALPYDVIAPLVNATNERFSAALYGGCDELPVLLDRFTGNATSFLKYWARHIDSKIFYILPYFISPVRLSPYDDYDGLNRQTLNLSEMEALLGERMIYPYDDKFNRRFLAWGKQRWRVLNLLYKTVDNAPQFASTLVGTGECGYPWAVTASAAYDRAVNAWAVSSTTQAAELTGGSVSEYWSNYGVPCDEWDYSMHAAEMTVYPPRHKTFSRICTFYSVAKLEQKYNAVPQAEVFWSPIARDSEQLHSFGVVSSGTGYAVATITLGCSSFNGFCHDAVAAVSVDKSLKSDSDTVRFGSSLYLHSAVADYSCPGGFEYLDIDNQSNK